jgi:hypothetical protein
MITPFEKQGFFYEEWIHSGEAWERVSIRAEKCPRIPRGVFGGRAAHDGGPGPPAGVRVRVCGCHERSFRPRPAARRLSPGAFAGVLGGGWCEGGGFGGSKGVSQDRPSQASVICFSGPSSSTSDQTSRMLLSASPGQTCAARRRSSPCSAPAPLPSYTRWRGSRRHAASRAS